MTLLRNAKKKQFLMLRSLLTKSQYISKQAFFQISRGKKNETIYLLNSFFFPQLYPDVISCRRGSSSSGASSAEPEKRRCLVALYDYDPFCSGVRGWPPHDQLTLKKGDVMTALEDQDANGFYRVFLNGESLRLVICCLVPSKSQSQRSYNTKLFK